MAHFASFSTLATMQGRSRRRECGEARIEGQPTEAFAASAFVYIPPTTLHNFTNTETEPLEYVYVVAPANSQPSEKQPQRATPFILAGNRLIWESVPSHPNLDTVPHHCFRLTIRSSGLLRHAVRLHQAT